MLVYFLFPAKKYKWTVLLAASMFFYAVAGYKYAFFILFTTLSTYLIALWISHVSAHSKKLLKEKKKEWDKDQKKKYKNKIKIQKRLIMTLALVINFGILAFLKYYGFFAGSLNDMLGSFGFTARKPTLSAIPSSCCCSCPSSRRSSRVLSASTTSLPLSSLSRMNLTSPA